MDEVQDAFNSLMTQPAEPTPQEAFRSLVQPGPAEYAQSATPHISPDMADTDFHEYAKQASQNQPEETRSAFQSDLSDRMRGQQLKARTAAHSQNIEQGTDLGPAIWELPKEAAMERARWGLGRVPFVNKLFNLADDAVVKSSAKRFEKGAATADDYDVLGRHLAFNEYSQKQGWGRYGLDLATQLPGEMVEWLSLAGPAAAGARALGLTGEAASLGGKALQFGGAAAAAGAVRTVLRPDKLALGVVGRTTPQVGIDEQGRLATQEGEGGWKALGKTALTDFLSNTSFEAAGVFTPKPGFSVGRIAGSTAKAIGAIEAPQEIGYRLGLDGEGSFVTQYRNAKTDEDRWRILQRAGVTVAVFGGLETFTHAVGAAKSRGVSDQVIDQNVHDAMKLWWAEEAKAIENKGPKVQGALQDNRAFNEGLQGGMGPPAPPKQLSTDIPTLRRYLSENLAYSPGELDTDAKVIEAAKDMGVYGEHHWQAKPESAAKAEGLREPATQLSQDYEGKYGKVPGQVMALVKANPEASVEGYANHLKKTLSPAEFGQAIQVLGGTMQSKPPIPPESPQKPPAPPVQPFAAPARRMDQVYKAKLRKTIMQTGVNYGPYDLMTDDQVVSAGKRMGIYNQKLAYPEAKPSETTKKAAPSPEVPKVAQTPAGVPTLSEADRKALKRQGHSDATIDKIAAEGQVKQPKPLEKQKPANYDVPEGGTVTDENGHIGQPATEAKAEPVEKTQGDVRRTNERKFGIHHTGLTKTDDLRLRDDKVIAAVQDNPSHTVASLRRKFGGTSDKTINLSLARILGYNVPDEVKATVKAIIDKTPTGEPTEAPRDESGKQVLPGGMHSAGGAKQASDPQTRINNAQLMMDRLDRLVKNGKMTPEERRAKQGKYIKIIEDANHELDPGGTHADNQNALKAELRGQAKDSGYAAVSADAEAARLDEELRGVAHGKADADIGASLERSQSKAIQPDSSASTKEQPASSLAQTAEQGYKAAPPEGEGAVRSSDGGLREATERLDAGGQPGERTGFPEAPGPAEGPRGGSGLGADVERPKSQTALANVITDQKREGRGLAPILREMRKTNPEIWDQAMALLDHDPKAGEKLVEELQRNPRATTDVENALLLQRRVALDNEWGQAMVETIAASPHSPAAMKAIRGGANPETFGRAFDQASAREAATKSKVDELDKVIVATGTEWGRAGQFRKQFVKDDYTLGNMLRQMESAQKGKPLSEADKAIVIKLQGEIEALQGKLDASEKAAAEAMEKLKDRKPEELAGAIASDPAVEKWTTDRMKALAKIREFREQVAKKKWDNASLRQRIEDWLIKARTAFVISSPTTVAKIAATSAMRLGYTPVEQVFGSLLKLVPGLSEIAARAPLEGRGFTAGEAGYLKEGLTQGAKDGLETLKKGRSALDDLFGKEYGPRTWLDRIGELHAALKAPAARARYERALANLTEHGSRTGQDVTSPAARLRIEEAAYKDSLREKFQQDNALVKWINDSIASGRAEWRHPAVRALATGAKLMMPVLKIPTNIVAETFQHAIGVPVGTFKAGEAFYKGVDKLSPQQADFIMRSFKKGIPGIGVLALGYWLGPDAIGGFYTGKRRRPDEPGAGDVGPVPSWATHHPLLIALQMGGAIARAEKEHPKEGQVGAISHGIAGLLEEAPLVREQTEVAHVFDRGVGNLAKSFVVPQLIQWVARRLDTTNGEVTGDAVQRKPNGVVENVESGVPGLRNTLPQRKPIGRR